MIIPKRDRVVTYCGWETLSGSLVSAFDLSLVRMLVLADSVVPRLLAPRIRFGLESCS